MKKIIYIISSFSILIFGYYFISFYPYLNNIHEIIQKVEMTIDNKEYDLIKKNILEEKRKHLTLSKQKISISSLLRRQAMMSVYNNFVVEYRKKKFNGLWRFDRLFWSYFSYLHFSNDDVIKIYLYYGSVKNSVSIR